MPRAFRVSLSNSHGLALDLVPHGASIRALRVPVDGGQRDIVLGYPDAASYEHDTCFMGATVGRYAGRIRHGHFSLDGRRHTLSTQAEQHGHCLHGGPGGLGEQHWALDGAASETSTRFVCHSHDGENGFPGALDAAVTYALEGDRLIIHLTAESTKDTVVNLTNHAYFNLNGDESVDDHVVTINAAAVAEIDEEKIPTGKLLDVAGTDFDLRAGARLADLAHYRRHGFDDSFALDKDRANSIDIDGRTLHHAARVTAPRSPLQLDVYTTQPSLQCYTGQYLAEPFAPRQGLCLEAQAFPDSPNQPDFPSTMLRAGDRYEHIIVYEITRRDAPTANA